MDFKNSLQQISIIFYFQIPLTFLSACVCTCMLVLRCVYMKSAKIQADEADIRI